MSFYWYIDGVRYPHSPNMALPGRKTPKVSEIENLHATVARTPSLPLSKHYERQHARTRPIENQIIAKDIMSYPVTVLPASTTILEAWALMEKYRYRHIPIVGATGQLIGIMSDRDLLYFALHSHEKPEKIQKTFIQQIMTKQLLTVLPEAKIIDIAKIIIQYQIGSLLAVDEQGTLQGIITRSDILRIIASKQQLDTWI